MPYIADSIMPGTQLEPWRRARLRRSTRVDSVAESHREIERATGVRSRRNRPGRPEAELREQAYELCARGRSSHNNAPAR